MSKQANVKGKIIFEIDDKKNVGDNTLTDLGFDLFGASARKRFSLYRGIQECYDAISDSALTFGSTIDNRDPKYGYTIYLLNIPQVELDALSSDDNFLPIYTAGTMEVDNSRIIGWATVKREALEAKEGFVTQRDGSTFLDFNKSSIRWEWTENTALGSVNLIAIGYNKVSTGNHKFSGAKISRGIQNSDYLVSAVNNDPKYVRPGITGITSSTEILLPTPDSLGGARIRMDLLNKTRTEIDPTDDAYDFPCFDSDRPVAVNGDKAFYIDDADNVMVYDGIAKTHTDTGINSYSNTKKSILVYNGYLYVPGSYYDLDAYDLSTYAAVTAENLDVETLIGTKIPSDYEDGDELAVRLNASIYTNFGTNILMTPNQESDVNDINGGNVGIVFDNFTDFNIQEFIPHLNRGIGYNVNSEMILISDSTSDEFDPTLDDNFNLNDYEITGQLRGIFISRSWGDMLSFKKYATPQTIASDQVAKVEYVYESIL